MARHRTTIRELAEYTGLSPAAVSYALRGMQVSAHTERRVREAAAELGYEADPIARALAGGATAVVGLLVGSLSDFWNQELVRAVQRELYGAAREHARGRRRRRAGARARARPAPRRPTRRRPGRRADRTGQRRVGGDRPAGGDRDDRRRAARGGPRGRGDLRQRARRPAEPRAPQRARSPARHGAVLGRGDARPTARPSARSRARRRRSASIASVVPCAYSLNGSRPLALELLAGADRPTAVLCMSDSIAYGVYAACAELGLSIPGDVAVAGFGDHPMSQLLVTAADLDGLGRRADRRARDRVPARGDRRRRPAGDAARDRRAGARRARVDGVSA